MLWGKKKPTIFDQDQNRRLQALTKNQTILVQGHNANIEEKKNLWNWVQHLKGRVEKLEADNQALTQHIQVLEAEAQANKQRDAELAAKFQSLGSTLSSQDETLE